MDWEFIENIDTWGSGGQMMDVLQLKDGRVLVIGEHGISLYENREAFDSGAGFTAVESPARTSLLRRCG